MRRFLQNIKYAMDRWAYGRYGYDELSRFLYFMGLAFIVLSFIPNLQLFSLVGFALFLAIVFRISSRNTAKRKRENEKYLGHTQGVRNWFSYRRQVHADRRTYRYFTCKKCGHHYRVPKGKGKVRITCPGCGEVDIRKT